MTKLIPILSGRCLVVELSEGANRFTVFNDDRPYLSFFVNAETPRVYLPEGNWRIVGMLSEVRESEAGEVIDEPFVDNLVALEAAITSEGFMFSGDECPNQFCYNGKIDMGYGEFTSCEICDESRVLARSRCLLLGRESN